MTSGLTNGLRPMAVSTEIFVFDVWLDSECVSFSVRELLKSFCFYFLPTATIQIY